MSSVLALLYMSFLPYFIFISVLALGTYRLWQHRNDTFLLKRSSFITFGLNISLIYAIIATMVVQYTMLFCTSYICQRIETLSFVTGLWLLFYFLNMKNFLIFFRYKWTHSIQQLKWQQLINPTDSSSESQKHETNWFIQHHNTFGSKKYIHRLFFILHLAGFTMHCASFLSTTNAVIASILGISSLLPPILFYPIIVAKTPSFNDIFFVQWESKMTSKILLFILFELFVIAALFTFHPSRILRGIVGGYAFAFSFFAMGYISTFQLIKKNMQWSEDAGLGDVKFNLKTILQNEESIHLFMLHLSKELRLFFCGYTDIHNL